MGHVRRYIIAPCRIERASDSITEDDDAKKLDLDGWNRKALFADWGDTKLPKYDGGFETGALIYSDIKLPAQVPFTDAATTIADATIRSWFALSNWDHDSDSATDALSAIRDIAVITAATQAENILIPVENPQVTDISRGLVKGDSFTGKYFGATGTLYCTTATCRIGREKTGTTPFEATEGTWSFVPDEGVMVMLPDQDWIAFGAWMTTPDDPAGQHYVGVVFDGMDPYQFTTAVKGLTGTATYSGDAAGVYVDLQATGMFTANAALTAEFGDATELGTLSGRIDDFKNSDGVFLGTDTKADPNDPDFGGESDWVVLLNAKDISDMDGTAATLNGEISGSADGVVWTEGQGQWNAHFYGPGQRKGDYVGKCRSPVIRRDSYA